MIGRMHMSHVHNLILDRAFTHDARTARDASLPPVVFLNGQRGVDFDGVEHGFVGEGCLIMGTTMKESLVSLHFSLTKSARQTA